MGLSPQPGGSGCLGPPGPARKGIMGLVPRNLEASREGEKESV